MQGLRGTVFFFSSIFSHILSLSVSVRLYSAVKLPDHLHVVAIATAFPPFTLYVNVCFLNVGMSV